MPRPITVSVPISVPISVAVTLPAASSISVPVIILLPMPVVLLLLPASVIMASIWWRIPPFSAVLLPIIPSCIRPAETCMAVSVLQAQ